MRRFVLIGTFPVIVAALVFIWQNRFERYPDLPTYRLEDLRKTATPTQGAAWIEAQSGPGIRLEKKPDTSPVVVRAGFPAMPAVDFLHVRYQMRAVQLVPGADVWKDGRCIIDWCTSGSEPAESDSVVSARGTEADIAGNFVIRPAHGTAVPMLRLEHLGQSGILELLRFEATAVRETWIWKIGRWLVMAGWLAWACAAAGFMSGRHGVRTVLAGSLCFLMGIYCVVPGPWKNLRPFGGEFGLGPEVAARVNLPAAAGTPLVAEKQDPPQSVGDIPLKGDLTLRIKFQLFKFRPLLHALLLLAPALAVSLLAGNRAAIALTILLAGGMEIAETAFGYGFDKGDVGDLCWDVLGIALGLLIARVLRLHAAPAFFRAFPAIRPRSL